MKHKISILANITLALLCLFLAYLFVDARIAVSYMEQGRGYDQELVILAKSLLLDFGRKYNRNEVELIADKYKDKYIVGKDSRNTLTIDQITFVFDKDKLVDVIDGKDPLPPSE